MKVINVLRKKSPVVFTISAEEKVQEALKNLISNNIGVLVVTSPESKVIGIISERDILRESFHNPDTFREKKVGDVMTKKLIIGEPDDDIEYIQTVMTQNRIRHIPILKEGNLVGLISIGDVVNSMLVNTMYEKKYLMEYISGGMGY